ncbi:MAG: DUF4129 domain-containing protein [Deltaproteobacteria bacterium]|nr:DUF4129 domain-containing protein [Deltaproteobacteria bacterium]
MISSRSSNDLISRLLAISVVLWLVAAVGTARAEPNPESLKRQAQEILSDSDYQTEWPDGEDARRRGRRRSGSLGPAGGVAMGTITWAIAWALVAVVVVVLLFLLVQEVAKRRRNAEADATMAQSEPAEPSSGSRPVLAEVDRLAAAGRYGEAVHLLLLIAVDRLMRRRAQPLEDSLTSREILRRLRLPPPGKAALERLVLGTERFLFAKKEVDRQELDACREAFELLEGTPL